jgi:hypothetical protein
LIHVNVQLSLAVWRIFLAKVNLEATGINNTKINIITIAPFESKVKRANLSTTLLNLVSSFLGLHFLHLLLLELSHFLAGVKLNKL